MFPIRLFAIYLVLLCGVECCAQVTSVSLPTSSVPTGLSVNRQIEMLIRSQFDVPPDYDVILGDKADGDIPGYSSLPATLVYKGKSTTVNFLISKDGKTLARLQTFDITNNPALAIDVNNRPIRGDAAAKVEIINFDDLECPFCAVMNSELLRETLDHYKGLIKIVYKDYPIEEIHPWAMHAAVDANCLAGVSDTAYWAYVDYVHSHSQDITGTKPDVARSFLALDDIAGTLGTQNKVDSSALTACIKQQDQSVVKSSLKLGTSLQLDGTPQVFVEGERLPSGARPVEELWPAIDRALKAKGIQPPSPTTLPSLADSGKAAQARH